MTHVENQSGRPDQHGKHSEPKAAVNRPLPMLTDRTYLAKVDSVGSGTLMNPRSYDVYGPNTGTFIEGRSNMTRLLRELLIRLPLAGT